MEKRDIVSYNYDELQDEIKRKTVPCKTNLCMAS